MWVRNIGTSVLMFLSIIYPRKTVVNGVTTTAMSGVLITALSGVTTTAMSGVITTAMSGVTTTAMSGVLITAMSGVITTAMSGVLITAMSGGIITATSFLISARSVDRWKLNSGPGLQGDLCRCHQQFPEPLLNPRVLFHGPCPSGLGRL